jgi:hypothetical protein
LSRADDSRFRLTRLDAWGILDRVNTFIHVLAWILAAGAICFTFSFLSKNEILKAFQSFCFASALFILGIVVERDANLNVEKLVCWVFGGFFLYLAFRFLEKDKGAEAFVVFFVAVGCLVAGFSSVQGFLKTELISTFVKSINSYGEKVDDFQLTLVRMQNDTTTNQEQLRILQKDIVKQQEEAKQRYKEIGNLEMTLSNAQTQIAAQSKTNFSLEESLTALGKKLEGQMLTNQAIQTNLEVAQSKLDDQQHQIGDVQHTVAHLFENMEEVIMRPSESNRVAVVHLGNDAMLVGFVMPDMPIRNSIDCWRQLPDFSSVQILPGMQGRGNFVLALFVGNDTNQLKDNQFIFRYVKDTVNTDLWYRAISSVSNRFLLDGNVFSLPYTNYGSGK